MNATTVSKQTVTATETHASIEIRMYRAVFRILIIAVVAYSATIQCSSAASFPPNVIVLIADDLGVGDIGFSGGKDIPTPNLDRLASEGTVFRHGYVFPMCAPTRAAFLTGCNPARIGFEDNRPGDSPHFGLDLRLKTIAQVLQERGYATGLIGKWHVGRGLNDEYSPWNRGFGEFLGYYGAFGTYLDPKLTTPPGKEKVVKGYSTDIFATAACDFIERHKDKPFFLNVAFNAAHLEQVAKPEDLQKFAHIQNPKRRKAAAIIANLDANIGRIAKQLSDLGLDENTLIVFFSDNGGEPPILGTLNGPFRGMKFDVYEGGIRVPFFLRWPAALPKGKVTDMPVVVSDLLPTIAAATGAQSPADIDGVDLLPAMKGENRRDPHETLFWRTTEHAALQRQRREPNAKQPVYIPHIAAVRQKEWKLVAIDDAGKNPRYELYDVVKDPSEKTNLAAKEKRVVKRLVKDLEGWKKTLSPQVIPPRPKVAPANELERPPITSRSDWGAKPPTMPMKSHVPKFITIHHTAVKQNRDRTLNEKLVSLQQFSQREDKLANGKTKPAWPDVPYHFYVAVDGKIGEGRDVGSVPNTNTSYDPTGHLTIVLEGNFETEEPSAEQMESTKVLIKWLAAKYKIHPDNVAGHKDYTDTACPGNNLHKRLLELRGAVH